MKNIYKSNKIVALCLLATMISVAGYSAAPSQINYQGRLLNDSGVPIDGETKTVTFKFYRDNIANDALNEGSIIQYTVTPLKGFFSIAVDVKPEWFVGGDVYMQVTVGNTTLGSRQKLVSSPYAIAVSTGSVGVDELKDGAVNLTKIDPSSLEKIYMAADGRLIRRVQVTTLQGEKPGYYSAVCLSGSETRYLNCDGVCDSNQTTKLGCALGDDDWIGVLLKKP